MRPSSSNAGWHVALLRGVNVGGKNMLPMRDLTDMFVAAGCSDVKTYIQSGNVVFRAEAATVKGLAERISQKIESHFGHRVPVVLRTSAQMANTVRGNPFLKTGVAEETLHVCFLANRPGADDVTKLDPARSFPDVFDVVGQDIYMQLPNGGARTKLTNAYFDSKLRTVSTVRNWRTVLKLLGMMEN